MAALPAHTDDSHDSVDGRRWQESEYKSTMSRSLKEAQHRGDGQEALNIAQKWVAEIITEVQGMRDSLHRAAEDRLMKQEEIVQLEAQGRLRRLEAQQRRQRARRWKQGIVRACCMLLLVIFFVCILARLDSSLNSTSVTRTSLTGLGQELITTNNFRSTDFASASLTPGELSSTDITGLQLRNSQLNRNTGSPSSMIVWVSIKFPETLPNFRDHFVKAMSWVQGLLALAAAFIPGHVNVVTAS